MANYYDIIFLTNIPAFYKIRQWNEVNKRKRILAVFTDADEKSRNKDFFSEKPEFEYLILKEKNQLSKTARVLMLLIGTKYSELVIGGWDCLPFILSAWISPRRKNAVICESSIFEYIPSFLKDLVKRCFLHRIGIAYPSGIAQSMLLDRLGFHGEHKITGGCGLLNYYEQPPYEERTKVKKFLYVGRFVEVKNLQMLIHVFNLRQDLQLIMVGFGELEEKLKAIAGQNVTFLGAKDNKNLKEIYRSADVFVLPSKSESWGLVVEEALNNGTPVIVSDKVGCRMDLVTKETGLVFQHDSRESLEKSLEKMCDVVFYNTLRKHISELNFASRAQRQVDVYL